MERRGRKIECERESESVSEQEVVVFVYNNKKIVAEAVLLAASKRSHRMCVGFFSGLSRHRRRARERERERERKRGSVVGEVREAGRLINSKTNTHTRAHTQRENVSINALQMLRR